MMKLKLQLFPNFILTQRFLLFSPMGNIQQIFWFGRPATVGSQRGKGLSSQVWEP